MLIPYRTTIDHIRRGTPEDGHCGRVGQPDARRRDFGGEHLEHRQRRGGRTTANSTSAAAITAKKENAEEPISRNKTGESTVKPTPKVRSQQGQSADPVRELAEERRSESVDRNLR
jgi:hypothetical protein